jgi:MSHA biogenesis protein MshJ
MIKQQWDKVSTKVNALSMRERVLVFATVTVVVLFLLNMLLLEPLFARQKALHSQISQQQQTMLEVQAQIAALVLENSPNAKSPQRSQINQIRQEIAEGNAYLKSSREKLVQPEKMAEHLRQLLSKNNRLQLVALQTLPATPLLEPSKVAASAAQDKQVFKHGVQLTLRGNYLDLLQYLSALESLPQQMYWARAQMSVVQYPAAEITLILYTLSLDKTWLQV